MTVSRVSVDIDSHVPNARLRVLRAYHHLQNMDAERVYVAVSSSQQGYHVEGLFDFHIPVHRRLEIRENLNDDPNRLRMDYQRAARGLPIGTMWREKGSNDGERREFETPNGAIDYVETTQYGWDSRARSLQNNGHTAVRDAEVPHTKGVTQA